MSELTIDAPLSATTVASAASVLCHQKETHSLLALRNGESRCRKLPKQPYRSTSKVSIIGIMSPPFLGRPKARS